MGPKRLGSVNELAGLGPWATAKRRGSSPAMNSLASSPIGPVFLAVVSMFIFPIALSGQGSLTPPGVPSPTMKTLDQVEARTPLAGGTSPLSIGSGSYYLTGNVTIAITDHGIAVTGSNVTIDLNGFSLTGPGSGSTSGSYLDGGGS